MKKLSILLFLLGAVITLSVAQPCNTPAPGLNACSAPLLCTTAQLNGICSSTSSENLQTIPVPFCGQVNNNQWYRFIAASATLSLQINITNCLGTTQGSGIQTEIYKATNCQNGATFTSVSNCWNTPGVTTASLEATGLVSGQIYYLMIDGWAGDICDYSIDVLSGSIGTGIFYYDSDGDGYGNPATSTITCPPPQNYVSNNLDCDDGNFAIHPGVMEICNQIDDNCNGEIDENGVCGIANNPCNYATDCPVFSNAALAQTNAITVQVGTPEFALASACGGATNGLNNDVWYRLIAPTDSSKLYIRTLPYPGYTGFPGNNWVMGLYKTTCPGTGEQEYLCSSTVAGVTPQFVLCGNQYTPGATYFIRLFPNSSFAPSDAKLMVMAYKESVCYQTPPPEDNCTGAAQVLSQPFGNTCQSTAASTNNALPATNLLACGNATQSKDIWVYFDAINTTHFFRYNNLVNVNGEPANLGIALYKGSCSGPLVQCAVFGTGGGGQLTLPGLVVNTRYYVRIWTTSTINNISSGAFDFCIMHKTPPNDVCIHAQSLPSCPLSSNGTTIGSTASSGFPYPSCVSGLLYDVWYQFNTGDLTTATVKISNTNNWIWSIIYTGSCAGGLTELPTTCGSGNRTLNLTGLALNTTYYVRICSKLHQLRGFRICASTGSTDMDMFSTSDPDFAAAASFPGSFITTPTGNWDLSNITDGIAKIDAVTNQPVTTQSSQSISELNWLLYPNPTSGIVHVWIDPNEKGQLSLMLTDPLGRQLSLQSFSSTDRPATIELDLSNYPSGIYFITLKTGEGVFQRSINCGGKN